MVLGLAMGTTAAWAVVDSAWFASRESDDYRRWAARFARWLYVGAFLWTAVAGTCYMLLGWRPEIRQAMFSMPWAPLTAVTGAAMLAPLAWLWIRRRDSVSRGAAALVGLLQFLVLAVNAVSRQVVQNLELKPYLDVAAQPTNTQWSAVVVFLVLFVAGLAGVAWMVGQAAQAGEAEEYPV
jgi:cytochrome bd-type quinol oxidase subunit 2